MKTRRPFQSGNAENSLRYQPGPWYTALPGSASCAFQVWGRVTGCQLASANCAAEAPSASPRKNFQSALNAISARGAWAKQDPPSRASAATCREILIGRVSFLDCTAKTGGAGLSW